MVRTIATTSLAFIVLAAFAMLAGTRADYPYPRPTPTFCEETPPLAPLVTASAEFGAATVSSAGKAARVRLFPPFAGRRAETASARTG